MARQERILSARGAAAISRPGRHSDGGGLYLLCKNGNRSWIFMFAWNGKQSEMGLGPYPRVTLAEARENRDRWRKVLMGGENPIEARKAVRPVGKTFGACAAELHAAKSSEWRNAVHAAQWRTTLETYAAPLYPLPVNQIGTEAVLSVLKPLWQRVPETASRVRGRIEAVLDYARAKGELPHDRANPARWKGHLAHLLPKRQKLSRSHFSALPYRDLPQFIGKLRAMKTLSALALEFLILTAARSGEVLGARWSEIDLPNRVWTIPASRMKAGIEHRVPLSNRAITILFGVSAIRTNEFVFPGRGHGVSLSRRAMAALLERLKVEGTVHGIRSSFRDWCGETTSFPREIAEACLAHSTGNATELAYKRSDFLEERRGLMEAWAAYCEPNPGGDVVPIRAAI